MQVIRVGGGDGSVAARRAQDGLPRKGHEVRGGVAGCELRKADEIHVSVYSRAGATVGERGGALRGGRQRQGDLPLQAPRPAQGRVDGVRPVGRRGANDTAGFGREPV